MPDNKPIRERLALWLAEKLTPTRRRGQAAAAKGERNQASLITADRLHSILTEAEDGRTKRLFALYRDILASDSHLWSALSTRKLAVLNKDFAILPVDAENADDVAAAEACRNMVNDFPGWLDALKALMDSALWPVVVLEKSFRRSRKPGLRFDLASLRQMDPQLLEYRDGCMSLEGVDPVTKAPNNTFEPVSPNDFVVHRGHLMTTPDEWGGPGRTLVFWWLFSTQDRDWWIRFLDRFGAPFLVGRYPSGNDDDKYTLLAAFDVATKVFGIAVSDETQVEVKDVAASSHGDAFEKFHAVANREKSKLILGQTLSSDAQPTGIGSGATSLQSEVRKDLELWDGMALGQTIRHQIFAHYLAINGLHGRPPLFIFPPDTSTEAAALGKLLTDLSTAGLEPEDEALEQIGKRIGFALRRKAQPSTLPGPLKALMAPTDADLIANDKVVGDNVAGLAQAFRGTLAPVRLILANSKSPADAEAKIRAFYADWQPGKVARLVEEVLTAHAANGAT